MFLHIGNNCLIKSKDIIGAFNLKTIEKNDIEKCEDQTLIVTDNKNYFSNISVATINKRLNENYFK